MAAHAGPLLVVDGDSFAHRSYHALPKSIRRADGGPAGAILGFANLLIKLYLEESPDLCSSPGTRSMFLTSGNWPFQPIKAGGCSTMSSLSSFLSSQVSSQHAVLPMQRRPVTRRMISLLPPWRA